MIKPYDLGEIVETVRSVNINDLVRKSKQEFKLQFISSSITLSGAEVSLATSKTRFDGLRLWFLCPKCNKRKGVLYSKDSEIACGMCFGLKYRKQRYKGMTELLLL